MNNVWQKESGSENYCDLFANTSLATCEAAYEQNVFAKHNLFGEHFEPIKTNDVSTGLRVRGNERYKEKRWRAAMESYSQSLRFAEIGTENVGLAYANRSACFFRLQKYSQCITDIELALVNNIPEKLIPKLEDRKQLCVNEIEKGFRCAADPEPKLSYAPNEKFSCLANVLELRTNATFGRHIVAKCDIAAGKTIFLEENFVNSFDVTDRIWCSTCLMPMKNFIPCQNCTDAMFCDETCMQNDNIHKLGCGATYNRLNGITFGVKSILKAVNCFETADELIEFVEEQLVLPKWTLPETYSDDKSKYGLFFKLNALPRDADISINYLTYKFLMDIPAIRERFDSVRKQRFLMHLIWHHKIIEINSTCHYLPKESGKIKLLSNFQSLFNHSCFPNILNDTTGNKSFAVTIRPVKKGEQLFVNYSAQATGITSTFAERQKFSLENFNFKCECERCAPTKDQPIDTLDIATDPIFFFIKCFFSSHMTNAERAIMKEKCFEFFGKYGHLSYTPETLFAIIALTDCLQKDYPEYDCVF